MWDRLLTPSRAKVSSRASGEGPLDLRSPFEKDYHRILMSSAFRRLQDKTQVFPLDQSDFVRTRLTHSLEVSSLAKSLAQQVCRRLSQARSDLTPTPAQAEQIADILSCAGLIHDIGNPPFGHYGETTIRLWFEQHLQTDLFQGRPLGDCLPNRQARADLLQFEGNAQALRVVSKVAFRSHDHGMNLTYPLLHTLIKYPVSSIRQDRHHPQLERHKFGYFYAERRLFKAVTQTLGTEGPLEAAVGGSCAGLATGSASGCAENLSAAGSAVRSADEFTQAWPVNEQNQLVCLPSLAVSEACRHPLTFLLEAADDLAYRTADIEDGFKKQRLSYEGIQQALTDFLRQHKAQEPSKHWGLLESLQNSLGAHRERAVEAGYPQPDTYAVQNWVVEIQSRILEQVSAQFALSLEAIFAGRFHQDLFAQTPSEPVMAFLGDLAYRSVFRSEPILALEVAADSILNGLLDRFVPACAAYDSGQVLTPVQARLIDLIPEQEKRCYHRQVEEEGAEAAERLYLRLLMATDFITGMTDSYAKQLYQKLSGMDGLRVPFGG